MGKYNSPILADLFVEWNIEIHGHPPYIKEDDMEKFRSLEDDIYAYGMDLEEYTRLVIKDYEWLVREKKMKSLPTKIFLSKKTLRKIFTKKIQGLSLKDDDRDVVMHAELRYAEYVIGMHAAGEVAEHLSTAAEMLDLPDEWYIATTQNKRPIREAASMMKSINGIVDQTNKYEIIGKLIFDRRNSKRVLKRKME